MTPEPRQRGAWWRFFWTLCGSLSLGLAVLGVPLPVLPTTPFLLLAAACFLKGSPKMHRWMMTNRYFGKYLSEYRAGQGVPLSTKLAAALLLWLGIGTSVLFLVGSATVRILLVAIGLGVTVHLARIKVKANPAHRPEQRHPGRSSASRS